MAKKVAKKKKPSWFGNPALSEFLMEVDAIRLDEKNARRHTEKSIGGIETSLRKFGQQALIVVDSGGVIRKGNGTYRAAVERMQWTQIAAIESNISDEELNRLYSVVDNRSGELSVWDVHVLAKTLQETFTVMPEKDWLSWWKNYELKPLLEASSEKLKENSGDKTVSITLTGEQRLTVDRALMKIRADNGDPAMTDGDCLGIASDAFMEGN